MAAILPRGKHGQDRECPGRFRPLDVSGRIRYSSNVTAV